MTCVRCRTNKPRVEALDRETGQIVDLCVTCVLYWAIEFDDVHNVTTGDVSG